MKRTADAIVVGGGPAGSLSALLLGRLGMDVVLVDARRPDQDICCGHCLDPRGLKLLEQHGLREDVERIATGTTDHIRIRSTRAIDEHGICVPVVRPHFSSRFSNGLLVPRGTLDPLLIDLARSQGVRVIQPARARVSSLHPTHANVCVDIGGSMQQLQTMLLVGADGLGSRVARTAGLAGDKPAGRKFGFSTTFQVEQIKDPEPGEILMLVDSFGYMGLVRQGDGQIHAASLVDRRKTSLADPHRILEHFLGSHCRFGITMSVDHQQARIQGAGPIPWRPGDVASGPVALVGDASGFAEPFTGEGMTWAFETADLLYNAVLQNHGWSPSAVAQYRQCHRRSVGRRQRICLGLASILPRRRVVGLALKTGRRLPRLARSISESLMHA